MIHPEQVVVAVLSGFILIVFGLAPGLFQALTEGVRNFSFMLVSQHPRPRFSPIDAKPPRGLAVVGAVVIAATLLAYLLN